MDARREKMVSVRHNILDSMAEDGRGGKKLLAGRPGPLGRPTAASINLAGLGPEDEFLGYPPSVNRKPGLSIAAKIRDLWRGLFP